MNLKTNLKKLLSDSSLNAVKLSKLTGVPKSTLSDWLSGNSPKNISQVKSVADHFKISIDELVYNLAIKKENKIQSHELELINFGKFDVYLKKVEK